MITAILCDVEGTTASIAFVKETLFPFARARMGPFVSEHADDPAVGALLAEARGIAGQPELDAAQTAALLAEWIDADRKAAPLKSLQGLIWEEGYRSGSLVGDIYPDAAAALKRWHEAGLRLLVYSSGSVEAQRLIFGHTPFGDLSPLFSGFFDTRLGGKLESASYAAIGKRIGLAPDEILFLSDSAAELEAAKAAGLRTTALDRGEVILPEGLAHPVARDFDAVEAIWRGFLPGSLFPAGREQAQEHRAPNVENLG